MMRLLKADSVVFLGVLSLAVTACGQNANISKHLKTADFSVYVHSTVSPSPSPSTSPSESPAVAHGYSLCESALQQLPLVRQDNLSAGQDVLGFVSFDSSGKVVIAKNDNVSFTETNCKNEITRVGFKFAGSSAHSEDLFFTYQDGKVKDVTVQRFQDGAWIRSKATFLLSGDESTCYVQHIHSEVEISQNSTSSSVEFDLETCRLANDVGNDPDTQAAVLKNGGLASMKNCESDFAKAALAQLSRPGANGGPDTSFHVQPAPQQGSAPQEPSQGSASGSILSSGAGFECKS